MSRRSLPLSLSLVLLALFARNAFIKNAESQSPGKPPSTIVLGATIPLSGNSASYGNLIRDGIKLAEARLHREGYSVQLVIEDVPSPGERAVSAVRKMVAVDKVDGIAANFFNGNIPAIAPIITHERIPTFHTAIADDLILGSGEYVFSTNSTIARESQLLAEEAVSQLHAKTAAILYIGTTFGEQYAKHFSKHFQSQGGKVLLEAMSPLGNEDHRAEILKLMKEKPDVVLLAYFGTNLGTVLKQLRQIDRTTPILSVYEAEDPSVLQVAGAAAEGILYFEPEPKKAEIERQSFFTEFQNAYGYTPRVLATNAYDATYLLGKSFAQCKKEKSCVLKMIRELSNYSGASGNFSIAKDQSAERPFRLKTCKKGEFVEFVRAE